MKLHSKLKMKYTITGADLNLYKQTNSYETGKANPFERPSSENKVGDGNTVENPGGSGSEGGSTNQNVDSNSSNTFFEETGLK